MDGISEGLSVAFEWGPVVVSVGYWVSETVWLATNVGTPDGAPEPCSVPVGANLRATSPVEVMGDPEGPNVSCVG